MKKILLLCQQGGCPIEVSPARYQLIHELKKRNYKVYVFYLGTIRNQSIRSDIDYLVNTKYMSSHSIRKKIFEISPEFVVAFTYEDTKILYQIAWIMKQTNFVYFNLEIYTPWMERYIQPKGKFLELRCRITYIHNKFKEILFTKQCKMFVIQDKLRKITAKKYFISHKNTILVPNTYSYVGMSENEIERQGVIYSGSLLKVVLESLLSDEMIISDIPLTFMGWSDDWFREKYKKLSKNAKNLKFCDQKLEPDAFTDFLGKFAIGLVMYTPSEDDNIDKIGLASGKFFRHLSLCQPVIVVDSPGISKVVRKYKLGVVIQDVGEIGKAYKLIMENYAYYQKNIERIYKEKFEYRKAINLFMLQLEKME